MVGFFFCLASAEGAGLLFCPATIQPHTSVYSGFYIIHELYRPRNKTAHGALQKLFRLFAAFFRCCVAVYPAILHHLRHDGAYHSAVAPPANTRYQRHAGRYTGQHSRPIIIRYIREQRCASVIDPCQTVQHIADHASPAGSAPTVCGSLASAAPGAPAEGSVPPPVPGQPGGGLDTSHVRIKPWHRVSLALCFLPSTGGAEQLAATAAALFGLSPDSQ